MSGEMAEAWAHIERESNMALHDTPEVVVVIPTIAGRKDLLVRAMKSISGEEVKFTVVVKHDYLGEGPAATRNRAVKFVTHSGVVPKWIAFLDDDDWFKPGHLTKLVRHAEETGADVVYPWFDIDRIGVIRNDLDPLFIHGKPAFGQQFDPTALDHNNFIPVTALVRTAMFLGVDGFPLPRTEEWPHPDCEDWALWRKLRDHGARFSHLPERTWVYHWHPKNTSGRPENARSLYGTE